MKKIIYSILFSFFFLSVGFFGIKPKAAGLSVNAQAVINEITALDNNYQLFNDKDMSSFTNILTHYEADYDIVDDGLKSQIIEVFGDMYSSIGAYFSEIGFFTWEDCNIVEAIHVEEIINNSLNQFFTLVNYTPSEQSAPGYALPRVPVNVTFEENGGTTVADLTGVTALPNPLPTITKVNSSFVGWYMDSAFNYLAEGGIFIYRDTTLYAKWSINPCSITFEENGGSNVADLYEATAFPNPLPTTTRPGYVFGGWYMDSTLSTPIDADATLTGDTTLYAKWSIDPTDSFYTVTFDMQGGYNPSSFSIEAEEINFELPIPQKGDLIFAGWYYDLEYTNQVNLGDYVTENIIIYAKWISGYKITFIENGGNEVSDLTDLKTIPSPLTGSFKNGYRFDGWYMDSTLSTPVIPGATLTNDITVYAKYTEYGRWYFFVDGVATQVYSYTEILEHVAYQSSPEFATWPNGVPTENVEGYYFNSTYLNSCSTFFTAWDSWLDKTTNVSIYIKLLNNIRLMQGSNVLATYTIEDLAELNNWPDLGITADVITYYTNSNYSGSITFDEAKNRLTQGSLVLYVYTYIYNRMYFHIDGLIVKTLTEIELLDMTSWPALNITFDEISYYSNSSLTNRLSFATAKSSISNGNVNVYVKNIIYNTLTIHYENLTKIYKEPIVKNFELWPDLRAEFGILSGVPKYYTNSLKNTEITLLAVKENILIGDCDVYIGLVNEGIITYYLGNEVVGNGTLSDTAFPTAINKAGYIVDKFFSDSACTNELESFAELITLYESDLSQSVNVYLQCKTKPVYNGPTNVYKNKDSIFNLSYIVNILRNYFTDITSFNVIIFSDTYTGMGSTVGSYTVVLRATNSHELFTDVEITINVINNLGVDCIIDNDYYITTQSNITKEKFTSILKERGVLPTVPITATFVSGYFDTPGTAGVYDCTITYNSTADLSGSEEIKINVLSVANVDISESTSNNTIYYIFAILLIALIVVFIFSKQRKKPRGRRYGKY